MTPTVLFVIVLSLGWPVHSSSVRNHTQALFFTDGQRVVELGVATPTLRRTAPDGQGLVDTTVTCRTYTHNTNQPLAMYGPIRAVDNDDMNMLLEICHNNPTHNRRHKRFILPGKSPAQGYTLTDPLLN
ncbi:uncharacterized protein LOC135476939 [Liolophura sinensis]|uniref:uncharacterized protein LOC135476939 n=1 Tax=Liolophura sinensis TaxID=3198878 RepID=UPI003158DA3F